MPTVTVPGRRSLRVLVVALLVLPFVAGVGHAAHEDPPNDPLFQETGLIGPYDWGMRQVRAREAWHATTGAGVTVAVIDSGVDLDHPDLAANLVAGRNFVGCETQPDGCGDGDWQNTDPPSDHGTHVAGIVGAVANNGEGVHGVAPDVSLMPIRVLDDDGGTFGEIAAGIDWAVAHGADVINMSLGADQGVQILTATGIIPEVRDAVQRAVEAGVVVVAAAGNEPSPFCGTPAWEPGVLCVIATGSSEQRTVYSGGPFNENVVDVVAAPGGELPFCDPDLMVLSTIPPELGTGCAGYVGYEGNAGTSMATPHVSGVAALAVAMGCSRDQTLDILTSTARQGNTEERGVFTPAYGWGIVDAEAAVAAAGGLCIPPTGSPPTASADDVETLEDVAVTIDVLANDSDADGDPLTIIGTTTAGFGSVEHDGATVTYTPAADRYGTDGFRYTITDGNGNTASAQVTVTVHPVADPAVTIDAPADGTTLETGPVEVTGSLVRPATGGTLSLVGDGTSRTSGDGATAAATYGLSSAGPGGASTEHTTAGSWNAASWENPFVPTFVGTEPVELSGEPLTLTIDVEYGGGALGCPVVAQLFTATTDGFAPNGAEASTVPAGGVGSTVEATFTFHPEAGRYDALGVQVATTGVDCGSTPARWVWGTTTEDGAVELASTDTLLAGPRGSGEEHVVVAVDGVEVAAVPVATVDGLGDFSATVDLADGGHTIAATWYDATGSVVGADSVAVSIGSTSTNTTPEAVGDEVTVPMNRLTVIDVLGNDTDADGDTLTLTDATQPVHGTVRIADGVVRYEPDRGFKGTDSFAYTVSDGEDTATATVTVRVVPPGGDR